MYDGIVGKILRSGGSFLPCIGVVKSEFNWIHYNCIHILCILLISLIASLNTF